MNAAHTATTTNLDPAVVEEALAPPPTPASIHQMIEAMPTEHISMGGEEEDDFFESDDSYDEYDDSSAEEIDLTFFVTHKTRPMDERTVTWFENQYKQQGLDVEEISYQHDYNKKEGIYFKLHIMDRETNTPTREIIQFMFPKGDVIFIARMEYPFGESRSVDTDWNKLLWGFDLT